MATDSWVVPGTPHDVEQRLTRALHPVRALWFLRTSELAAWERATAPLYVRRVGPGRLEVGPRLFAPSGSRFSPQWRLTLVAVPEGTRIERSQGWDRLTTGLLAGWGLFVVVAWARITLDVQTGDAPTAAYAWWAVLAGATLLVPYLGATRGGAALLAQDGWLRQVSGNRALEDEDWGSG